MIGIKEKCEGKVWKALQFMVDGLRRQSKRDDFKVDMDNFGYFDRRNNVCYGCAATCSIQEISGINLSKNNIDFLENRSYALKIEDVELFDFECAIDDARQGDLESLFIFFDKNEIFSPSSFNERFFLTTRSWQTELPRVEQLISELKEKDI